MNDLKFDFIINFPSLDIRGKCRKKFFTYANCIQMTLKLIHSRWSRFSTIRLWLEGARWRCSQLPWVQVCFQWKLINFNQFNFSLRLENPRARISMRAKKYQKNGQTFLNFEKFLIKIQVGKKSIKLSNLFQGNPSLEEIGNSFINGNSDFFLSKFWLKLKFIIYINGERLFIPRKIDPFSTKSALSDS